VAVPEGQWKIARDKRGLPTHALLAARRPCFMNTKHTGRVPAETPEARPTFSLIEQFPAGFVSHSFSSICASLSSGFFLKANYLSIKETTRCNKIIPATFLGPPRMGCLQLMKKC
jgi:hypothetical protein